ncbi:effector-associated domain EAD1-containing protein [Parafrankia sp. EUN1f]|uniref:effector-associated domain EAD1-containing protein n=1 Tax=Parafrankia sp. EUN1f TaxID=102897 RepID=UPI00055E33E3|nr:effector-associated domain EAD1-containing protein [Parafrankia sp. EUN1f]
MDLDVDRLEGLTGPQLRSFFNALKEAFPERAALDQFLLFNLDKRVGDYAGDGKGISEILMAVLTAAKAEGWLPQLVAAASEEAPYDRHPLRIFALKFKREGQAPNPPRMGGGADSGGRAFVPAIDRYFNSTFFDLASVDDIVLTAAGTGAPVLAFASTYAEDMYLDKLQVRIEGLVSDDVARKTPINLREDIRPPELWADELCGHRDELAWRDLSFRVHVDGVERGSGDRIPAAVEVFWDRVRSDFIAGPRQLVLLFVSRVGMALPDDIIVLDPPRFTPLDVRKWAHGAVSRLAETHGWPLALRWAWQEQLCRRAALGLPGSDVLDVRALYSAIDESVDELHRDQAAFRGRLEGTG